MEPIVEPVTLGQVLKIVHDSVGSMLSSSEK